MRSGSRRKGTLSADSERAGIGADPSGDERTVGNQTALEPWQVSQSRFSGFKRQVFDFMHRNALPATEFFHIPPNRVIELGGQVEM